MYFLYSEVDMFKKIHMLFFIFICNIISAAPNLTTIDQTVNQALETFQVPGAAVGVILDGKIILQKGYGYRNLDENLPVTEKTLFPIASCTKAFTAFLLGQLVHEGKIAWDDPVVKYIPELRLWDPYATHHVTIRDLLAHRTGLARHAVIGLNRDITRNGLIRAIRYLEPAFELREKCHYNDIMYAVAGIVIERVTEKSWEKNLSFKIFKPLGMKNSNTSIESLLESEDFSYPHISKNGEIFGLPFREIESIGPAGSINSNIEDLLKWVQMQLSKKPLIDPRILQEMHTIQVPISLFPSEEAYDMGYGLGWFVGNYRGYYSVSHFGLIDGFYARITMLPLEKLGVIILTNSCSDGNYLSISTTNEIIDRVLELEKRDWFGRNRDAREQMQQALREASLDQGEGIALARPLADYVGTYEHPAYGEVQVEAKGNGLVLTYSGVGVSLELSHKIFDIFTAANSEDIPVVDITGMFFSFFNDHTGVIDALHIPLEPTVKPIIFKRKVSGQLLDLDYLKKFVGVYGKGNISIEVRLNGTKLIASYGDQDFELIPEKENFFRVKGFEGYRIICHMKEGKVSEVILRTVHGGSYKFKAR